MYALTYSGMGLLCIIFASVSNRKQNAVTNQATYQFAHARLFKRLHVYFERIRIFLRFF
jgi:hypothetical protein